MVSGEAEGPTLLGMLRGLRWQDAVAMAAFVGTMATGYNVFVGRAQAAADAGVAPLKLEIEAVKSRVATIEQGQTLVRADVHELALDVRASYRAQMTGERQERLEKPPRDAGDP